MEKTEFIKKLINETGLNMKTFAEKAGIPYTTLRSMLERGIENASVNNVIKVCKQLDICVETLYDMCKEDTNISSEEKTLLENYKNSNDEGKKMILSYSDYIMQNHKDNTADEISATIYNVTDVDFNSNNKEDDEEVFVPYKSLDEIDGCNAAHADDFTDEENNQNLAMIKAFITKRK